ncbi:MAG: phosphate uptake regulator PhoU [Candidatus Freyarchaeota archaeon]
MKEETLKSEKKMLRLRYHDQLKKLADMVTDMGELSIVTVRESVNALKKQDVEQAQKVIEIEKKVDDLEFEIERICMELLALQQPMAEDLRFIVTCLKIITDIDRISDYSGDIAEIAIKTAGKHFFNPLIYIPSI